MDVNKAVYITLTAGMIISFSLFSIGFGIYAATEGKGRYMEVLSIATMTLILTPLTRVAAAFSAFTRNKELSNALTSLIVLTVMLLSLILGMIYHVKVK